MNERAICLRCAEESGKLNRYLGSMTGNTDGPCDSCGANKPVRSVEMTEAEVEVLRQKRRARSEQ